MTPIQQLEASRQAIVSHLHGDQRRGDSRPEPQAHGGDDSDNSHASRRGEGRRASGWRQLAAHAVRGWWRHQPAYAVARIARPVLNSYASERPLQLVGIAAGIGAAAVVLKPWRMVSLGAVVAATLKSQDLSALLGSVLAQGFQPGFNNNDEEPTP